MVVFEQIELCGFEKMGGNKTQDTVCVHAWVQDNMVLSVSFYVFLVNTVLLKLEC